MDKDDYKAGKRITTSALPVALYKDKDGVVLKAREDDCSTEAILERIAALTKQIENFKDGQS